MQLECIAITEARGGAGQILHFNNPATPGGSLELRVSNEEAAFARVGQMYECVVTAVSPQQTGTTANVAGASTDGAQSASAAGSANPQPDPTAGSTDQPSADSGTNG